LRRIPGQKRSGLKLLLKSSLQHFSRRSHSMRKRMFNKSQCYLCFQRFMLKAPLTLTSWIFH
jgi:hypothetical protein